MTARRDRHQPDQHGDDEGVGRDRRHQMADGVGDNERHARKNGQPAFLALPPRTGHRRMVVPMQAFDFLFAVIMVMARMIVVCMIVIMTCVIVAFMAVIMAGMIAVIVVVIMV